MLDDFNPKPIFIVPKYDALRDKRCHEIIARIETAQKRIRVNQLREGLEESLKNPRYIESYDIEEEEIDRRLGRNCLTDFSDNSEKIFTISEKLREKEKKNKESNSEFNSLIRNLSFSQEKRKNSRKMIQRIVLEDYDDED